jgi:hypothetical protein
MSTFRRNFTQQNPAQEVSFCVTRETGDNAPSPAMRCFLKYGSFACYILYMFTVVALTAGLWYDFARTASLSFIVIALVSISLLFSLIYFCLARSFSWLNARGNLSAFFKITVSIFSILLWLWAMPGLFFESFPPGFSIFSGPASPTLISTWFTVLTFLFIVSTPLMLYGLYKIIKGDSGSFLAFLNSTGFLALALIAYFTFK